MYIVFTIGAIFVLTILSAAVSPLVVLLNGETYSSSEIDAARKHGYATLFFTLPVMAFLGHVSLAHKALNVVALMLFFGCALLLSTYSFHLKPKFVGLIVGSLAIVGSVVISAIFAFGQLFEDVSPATVELGDSVYCKQAGYGFVSADSGTTIEVFRRYFFVFDVRITRQRISDVYPESNAPVKHGDEQQVIDRCKNALIARKTPPRVVP